jgi:CRP-like cAMP-binding protein
VNLQRSVQVQSEGEMFQRTVLLASKSRYCWQYSSYDPQRIARSIFSTVSSGDADFKTKLKEIMIRTRTLKIYYPRIFQRYVPESEKINVQRASKNTNVININYSLSNLAGHGSFMCLAMSYMESDFFYLRTYAFTGISLAMIFQYYRPTPLWIPISWNSFFLLINLVMITLLLKEENEASKLPEEETTLYKAVFQKRGMKPVDFLHLISISQRIEFHEGEKIMDEKKKNNRVYLVKKGKLNVVRDGQQIGTIEENQFTGEMSFLSWSNAVATMQESLQSLNATNSSDNEANKQQTKSLYKFMSLLQDYSSFGSVAALSSSSPTLTSSAAENPENEGFKVQASVVCDDDECIVYSWKFRVLHELMTSNPSLGFVFERCLSDDLNRKFSSSAHNSSSSASSSTATAPFLKNDMKAYYKQILFGGLMDYEVNETEKVILTQFREKYAISEEEHEKYLKEFSWTKEEYDLGYKL